MSMPFRFQPTREIVDAEIISEGPHSSTNTQPTMNPNPEKAVSQESQATSRVSYNALEAAFGKLGVTPDSFRKEAVNDSKNEGVSTTRKTAQSNHNHKGPARKGEPDKIKAATARALEEEEETNEINKIRHRIERDLSRFEDDKKIANQKIHEIKSRIKEAETSGHQDAVISWNARLEKAADLLNMIEKTAPSVDEISDEAIRKELREYHRARQRQENADKRINKGNDPKADEVYHQAQSEALEIKGRIEGLLKKRNENPAVFNPVRDESVSLPNKEAVTQRKEWLEHHKKSQADSILEAVPAEETAQEKTEVTKEVPPKQLEQSSQENKERLTRLDIENMQTEAYENFGELHTPEEHNASLPVLAEAVEGTSSTQQEEKKNESHPVLNAEQINGYAENNKLTREAALAKIANIEKAVDVRKEQTRVNEDLLHKIGETWNKFPLHYKVLLSTGMIASGLGAAITGATATAGLIASIGAGMRFVGGTGMFVAFENGLRSRAERNNVVRSKNEELRDTVLAASLSIFVVGVLPGIVRDYAVEHGFFDKVRELFGGHTAHVEASASAEAPVQTSPEYTAVAEAGDSRWSLAERALAEGPYKDQFNAIASDEQRTYIIDALKDKLTVGMTAEQANALNVGDKIDFKEIFADKGFMDKTFSGAQHLSASEIANIQDYGVEVSAETPPRTVSADELLGQPLLTDFTPPEQPTAPIPRVEAGKLADSLISSSVNIPTPEEIIAPPPAVTAETVGLVSLATAATTMPQEFTPKDPQVLAYIDQQFHTDIDTLFGKKGILGIGKMDGMKSVHWLDFENRTFTEIKNAVLPEGTNGVGMNNPDALKKMQSYLLNVSKESKIRPEEGETAGKYIRRAMEMTASRLQTTQ